MQHMERLGKMEIRNQTIDAGRAFDWGRVSEDYARYRDIYPKIFYENIAARGLCIEGQQVLDLGTGTGVLPRNMYHYGAKWTGTDISEEQIAQAKRLAEEMGQDISYQTVAAEEVDYPEHTFHVVTACQCFWYFDYYKLLPKLVRMLRPGGKLLLLYMAWLPFEDSIAAASERLVLRYSPNWSGAAETMHPITVPDCVGEMFEQTYHEEYPLEIPFKGKAGMGG